MDPTDLEIAWAAGLFEGEGCISFTQRKRLVILTLASSDRDVVDRFLRVVGRGAVRSATLSPSRLYTGQRKPMWRWSSEAEADVQHIMGLISPYLGERRQARWMEVQALRQARLDELHNTRSSCIECGQSFQPASNWIRRALYCSNRCRARVSNRRMREVACQQADTP